MIILDCGSGNTCKNSIEYACRMVKEIAEIGSRQNIIIKWQLFKRAGDNAPLSLEVFERAYRYAAAMGMRTTASVFDKDSLDFLLTYDVPFIKLANTDASRMLAADIPEDRAVIISTDKPTLQAGSNFKIMYCISEYPAKAKDYIDKFGDKLSVGLSDHTTDFELFKKYQPKIYECHVKLDDSTGPDAGKFARTPEHLKEILL